MLECLPWTIRVKSRIWFPSLHEFLELMPNVQIFCTFAIFAGICFIDSSRFAKPYQRISSSHFCQSLATRHLRSRLIWNTGVHRGISWNMLEPESFRAPTDTFDDFHQSLERTPCHRFLDGYNKSAWFKSDKFDGKPRTTCRAKPTTFAPKHLVEKSIWRLWSWEKLKRLCSTGPKEFTALSQLHLGPWLWYVQQTWAWKKR